MGDKTTITITKGLLRQIRRIADKQRRSAGQQAELFLSAAIAAHDTETADIARAMEVPPAGFKRAGVLESDVERVITEGVKS